RQGLPRGLLPDPLSSTPTLGYCVADSLYLQHARAPSNVDESRSRGMNVPSFTAELSLYRTRVIYRVAMATAPPTNSIVLALTSGENAACDACEQTCGKTYSTCLALALATVWIPWLGGGIGVGCVASAWLCLAECNAEGGACCPKSCGSYCCSHGDQCSHYSGCCPGDRVVCDGRCCAPDASCCGNRCCNAGQTCCGEACCAPGETCCGGKCCSHDCCGETCCDAGVPCCGDSCCGFAPGPPPPPPVNHCIFGGAPCGPKCCAPGLECCGYSDQFGADCKTSCLH
ncbi:MAG: hypothetical protein JWO56_1977, partial [Acidobacteria bacterium]|nr:hypothetical protein [Acidobacteriota bacterium]